jgi:hypothetical protein
MKRFPVPLVALVAALGVIGGAVVLASGDGPYAFKVDGHVVSQATFDDELGRLHEHPVLLTGDDTTVFHDHGYVAGTLARGWLQFRIQVQIARDELRRSNVRVLEADRNAVDLPTSPGFKKLPADLRRTVIDDLATLNVFKRVVGGDDAALAAQLQKACPSGRYVSHILVASEAVATAIKRQLDQGGDFAKLATANSIDTGSNTTGGRLGCVDGAQFVEPFETVVATLPLNVVSNPIQTQYGWHVIVVRPNDPTDAETQTASDAIANGSIAKILTHLRVEIDPRYGRWSPKTAAVLAPKAQTG